MSMRFITRHVATESQREIIRVYGLELTEVDGVFKKNKGDLFLVVGGEMRPMIIDGVRSIELDEWIMAGAGKLAVVAPAWAILDLLRAGVTCVEFVNAPDARFAGQFVCTGHYMHTLSRSDFYPAE